MHTDTMKRMQRQGFGLMLYRMVLNVAFLWVAFSTFPDLKIVFAIALLVFNQGVAAVGHTAAMIFQLQNQADDEAERKTRHTILLAHERAETPELLHGDFWTEVNRRVADEQGHSNAQTSGWASAGLTAWNFIARAMADIATVVVVAFLTPAY